MARKHIGPALYEVMGGRRSEPRPAAAAPPQRQAEGRSWLSPGRTVRVPVGYLLLAAAVTVVALVASFTVGYGRGEAQARADSDEAWLAANQQNLAVPPPEIPQRDPPHAGPTAAPSRPPEAGSPSPVATPTWGPIESDPREAGKNYFVLIYTRRDGAVRFARFCRDNGVEAYVVPANNSRFYNVVALPGYDWDERMDPFVTDLEERIAQVARKWTLQNARDEITYYPEKFDG